MNRIFRLLAFVLLAFAQSVFADDTFNARLSLYGNSSVLSSGKWVKIKLGETGVYKLTYSELRAMGFSDPSKVSVFGYGGAPLSQVLNANYVDDLPEVRTYRGSDYILFYGVANLIWSFSYEYVFKKNAYADYGCYFLTDSKGQRLAIQQSEDSFDNPTGVVRYYETIGLEMPEEINLSETGTEWYGDAVIKSGKNTYSFSFPDMIAGDTASLTLIYASKSINTSTVQLTSNGTSGSVTLAAGSSLESGRQGRLLLNYVKQPSYVLSATTSYNTESSTGMGYLYYLCAVAKSRLTLNSSCWIPVHCGSYKQKFGSKSILEFRVGKANSASQVWNVSDLNNIYALQSSYESDTLSFISDLTFTDLVVVNPSGNNFNSIASYENVDNQNLHALSGYDMVIISPSKFVSQAEDLADLHRLNDNLAVVVVTPEQIYNEFSSGTPDPTAYRAFMKMLYDKSNSEGVALPKYLLIFGDGLYDNRGLLQSSSSVQRNLVLTYQLDDYSGGFGNVSDDYYGLLADNASSFTFNSESMQIGVGRLPVATEEEATQAVAKVEAYMQNSFMDSWKQKYSLIADDNELSTPYHLFISYAEKMSKLLTETDPDIQQKKIYYDAYTRVVESSGARYPEVEDLILEQFNNGSYLINYCGHSGYTAWSEEKTFKQAIAKTLTNKKQGFLVSASCEFGRYDSYTTSAGESLVLNPNGGNVGVISSQRQVYATDNDKFNRAFVESFYSCPGLAIGDVMIKAKNSVSGRPRHTFSYMGDPALRLLIPTSSVVTDSIANVSADGTVSLSDTVSALAHIRVFAHIERDSAFLSDFNGTAVISVYDKEQSVSTKGNNDKDPTTYTDYPNVIFSGKANVENGLLSYDFIVPKDIAYNFGNGRISYYAYDTDHQYEAKGSYSSFVVGGSAENINWETTGPAIALYMNSTSFRSGDKVNSTPVFLAKIADESGINAAGSGVGHDLVLTLDNGSDPVTLNSYFSYDLGSCTSGSLSYQLSELEDGKYTLTFRAWDMLNNSSTQSIDFVVDHSCEPSIIKMVAYPNPVAYNSSVNIKAYYDRPETLVSYRARIFDLNGRMISQLDGSEVSEQGELSLTWDLTNSAGGRVNPGIYVYRLEIKTSGGEFVGNTEKILVLPQ